MPGRFPKNLDFYPERVGLTFDGKGPYHRTTCGFLGSLLTFLLLALAIFSVIMMKADSNPHVLQDSMRFAEGKVALANLTLFLYVTDVSAGDGFGDPVDISTKTDEFTVSYTSSDPEQSLSLEECAASVFSEDSGSYLMYRRRKNILYCSQNDEVLEGSRFSETPVYSQL